MRLIDAEKLTKDLIENKSFYPAIVKRAIEEAPNEDVVPRAELEKAKQEVASNMLEDFLKLIAFVYNKWVFELGLEDTEKEMVMELFQDLDTTELKKKYIGE